MRQLGLVVVACSLTLLAGCAKEASGPAQNGPKKFRVAVVPKGTSHAFWQSIHAGARKAEQEFPDVEVIWKGPAEEDDQTEQINIVQTYAGGRADAIVLAPLDRAALVKPVEEAMKNKVPVVIIDSGIDTKDITSYIATDNYNGGALAAKHMGKLLEGKGNVIVLRYQVGSDSTEQREKGFLDTLAKEFPDIKILSSDQYSGATLPAALAQAENLLTRFKGDVNGWFCPCEPVTAGTARAAKNAGLAGKIKIVGFDSGSDVITDLREGTIHGLVLQDPVNMGYLGVKTALAKLKGETVEPQVATGEYLVTPENIDEPRSKELHSADLSKWLGNNQ